MDPRHDDIERYLGNRMTAAERHAFEKRALSDPFLAEAIDGAQSVKAEDFSSDVNVLRERINIPAKSPVAVALGWLIWNPKAPTEIQTSPEASGPAVVDTVSQAAAEAKAAETSIAAKDEKTSQPDREPDAIEPVASIKPESASGAATSPTEPSPVAEAKEEAIPEEPQQESRKAAASPMAKRSAAPDQVVTGKVIEAEDGIPLGNVTVKDAETQLETRTRGDGSYSLPVKSEKPVLQYSFPGLQSVEQRASNDMSADVRLSDDLGQRSEVIAFPPDNWALSSSDDLQLATPRAGIEAYQVYLEDNIKVPSAARSAGVSGKVTVSFTVDPSGGIKDLEVIKGLGHGCDEEAIRLVRSGPAWRPATYRKAPVASTVWIKLEFPAKP
jgi:TonB family protein